MAITSLLGSAYTTPLYGSSLLGQLLASNNQPLDVLKQEEASDQTQISNYGQLQNALTALQTAATALGGAGAFSDAYSATASTAGVFSATASSAASPGSYSVQVNQLAQAQNLLSAGQASDSTAIGSGAATTLSFQFGTVSGGTFTADPARPAQTVTIDSTNNTLQGIAGAINAAAIGVNASVIYNGSSDQLDVTPNQTGAANSLSIGVTGDTTLQTLLTYTPGVTGGLTQTAAAQDAQATVNGVAVTSGVNTLSDTILGVTMNLIGIGSSTLTVAPNPAPIISDISAFVSAYNQVQSQINKYESGSLANDPLPQGVQAQLSNIIETSLAGFGNLPNLAQLGITINPNHTLTLDKTALQQALVGNPSGVAQLFTGNNQGIADQVISLAQNLTGAGGAIPTQVNALGNDVLQLQNQQQNANFLASLQKQDLVGQYAMLNGTLSSMQNTGQFLADQLGVPSSVAGLNALMGNNGNALGSSPSYMDPLALAASGFLGQSGGFPYLF